MTRTISLIASLFALAGPAYATEIFDAQGSWVGEGQLATGAEAPLERGRCRVDVEPKEDGTDVSVTGHCAVAVGKTDISLRIVRSDSGRINAGMWTAATGQTVQYSGTETGSTIELVSTTPLMVEDTPYESRVNVDSADADGFAIQQLLRAEGVEAWHVVLEMTYRQVGG